MELNMQYIYQVYQDGSFTKAAEKLFLTQPALSMAVRQEEKILGAVLFDRSRRPLALTPAGEAYIRATERVKYLEAELGRELEDLRDVRTGRLHVGGHPLSKLFSAGRAFGGVLPAVSGHPAGSVGGQLRAAGPPSGAERDGSDLQLRPGAD